LNTDDVSLSNFFSKYGTVTNIKILYDKNTGKARGLAFVEFASRAEAQAAIDDQANLLVDGRNLTATFSDEKEKSGGGSFEGRGRGRGDGNGFRGGNSRPQSNYQGDKFTAFVGNLGFKTNENTVRSFFEGCGSIIDVRVAKNEEGRSKGFAHIDFETNEALEKAKGLAGQNLDGREIRVDGSLPRGGGGDRGGFGGGIGRGGFGGGRGRGGFGRGGGDPMDRAKKTGAMIQPPANAVTQFDDSD